MIKKQFLVVIALLSAMLWYQCCKDDVDPCADKSEFQADFQIGDVLGERFFETDTCVWLYVTFKAIGEYDSVKWRVGNDPTVRTTPLFRLTFDDELIGETFQVRFIGYHTPDTLCFPNDDGVDTIYKSFYRGCNASFPCSNSMTPVSHTYLGTWEGHLLSNPSHTFRVKIVDLGDTQTGFWGGQQMFNLPEDCGGVFPDYCGGEIIGSNPLGASLSDSGYKSFYVALEDFGCCPGSKIWGSVNEPGKIQIEIDYNENIENDTFVGIQKF